MKKKLVIFGILLLVIVNISALTTIAYKRWSVKNTQPITGYSDRPMHLLRKKLKLSNKQMKQIKLFIKNFELESEDILDSLRQKEKELMDEVMANDPDPEKLNKLIEEIGVLQVTFKKKAISYLLKKKSIMTLEQQRKFMTFINKRHRHKRMIGNKKNLRAPGK